MTDPHELHDVLTPVPLPELLPSLWRAYQAVSGLLPTRTAIELLGAHWALETGWGKACHCWNLGNAKSVPGDGRCWTFFACGEELTQSMAERYVAADPIRVQILRLYTLGSTAMASVRFLPDHPGCRFRAFETLADGACDYVALLHGRYAEAFRILSTGDAGRFCDALRRRGYFTADPTQYARGVAGCLPRVRASGVDLDSIEHPAPDVTQESVQPPPIVPIERDLDGEKDERDQQVAGMYDSTEGGL